MAGGTVGGSGDSVTIPGLDPSHPYHIIWRNITANFPVSAYEHFPETDYVSYYYGTPASHPGCNGLQPQAQSIDVISEIDLPNSQKYTFTYDVDHYGNQTLNPNNTQYGLVDSITYPDAGLKRQTVRSFASFPNYTAYYASAPPGTSGARPSIFDKPSVVTVGPDSTPEISSRKPSTRVMTMSAIFWRCSANA